MAESIIPNTLNGKTGTIITGTNAQSLSVPAKTTRTICSLSLPTGKWIIVGGHQWSTSFDVICVGMISSGDTTLAPSSIRYHAEGGGGYCSTIIVDNFSSNSMTIDLRAYNGDSSARIASDISLKAIRIA